MLHDNYVWCFLSRYGLDLLACSYSYETVKHRYFVGLLRLGLTDRKEYTGKGNKCNARA